MAAQLWEYANSHWIVQRMRWLDGMSLSKLQETVKNREVWQAAVHRVAKSWTWPSNWTTIEPYTLDEWIVWYVSSLKELPPQKKKKKYWEKSQSFIGKNFCWLTFSKMTGYTAHKLIYTCMWVSEQVFAQSCLTLWDPMNCTHRAPLSNSPGKNTGVGCHFLLHNTYMIIPK